MKAYSRVRAATKALHCPWSRSVLISSSLVMLISSGDDLGSMEKSSPAFFKIGRSENVKPRVRVYSGGGTLNTVDPSSQMRSGRIHWRNGNRLSRCMSWILSNIGTKVAGIALGNSIKTPFVFKILSRTSFSKSL